MNEWLDAIRAALPDVPAENAMCHIGIVEQVKCGHCQRIVAAHAALAKIEAKYMGVFNALEQSRSFDTHEDFAEWVETL